VGNVWSDLSPYQTVGQLGTFPRRVSAAFEPWTAALLLFSFAWLELAYSKQRDGRELIGAIRRVLGGQIYLSDEISTRLLGSLTGKAQKPKTVSPVDLLTDRELEVFTLIGQAKETKEIARQLGMSGKTVEAHRAAIKRKLALKTGPELTRHAVLWVEAVR
jgi:DNA-binding NarL/FixJ family response regulator